VNSRVLQSARLSTMFHLVDLAVSNVIGEVRMLDIGSGPPCVSHGRIVKSRKKYVPKVSFVVTNDKLSSAKSMHEYPELKHAKKEHYHCDFVDMPEDFEFDIVVSYMAMHHVLGPGVDVDRWDAVLSKLDVLTTNIATMMFVVPRPSIYSSVNTSSTWKVLSREDNSVVVMDMLSGSVFRDPLPDYIRFADYALDKGFVVQFITGNNVITQDGFTVNVNMSSNDTMVMYVQKILPMKITGVEKEYCAYPEIPLISIGLQLWKSVKPGKSLYQMNMKPNLGHYCRVEDVLSYVSSPENFVFFPKLNGESALLLIQGGKYRLETRSGCYVSGRLQYQDMVLAQCEIVEGNLTILHVLSYRHSALARCDTGFSFVVCHGLACRLFKSYKVSKYDNKLVWSKEGVIMQNMLSQNNIYFSYVEGQKKKFQWAGTAAYVKTDDHGVDFTIPVAYNYGENEFGSDTTEITFFEVVHKSSTVEIVPKAWRPDKTCHTMPMCRIVDFTVLEETIRNRLSMVLPSHKYLEVGAAYLASLLHFMQFGRKSSVGYVEFEAKYRNCIASGHFCECDKECPVCDDYRYGNKVKPDREFTLLDDVAGCVPLRGRAPTNGIVSNLVQVVRNLDN